MIYDIQFIDFKLAQKGYKEYYVAMSFRVKKQRPYNGYKWN